VIAIQVSLPDSGIVEEGDTIVPHARALNGYGDSVAADIIWVTADTATLQVLDPTTGATLGRKPPSGKLQAQATARDTEGHVLEAKSIAWSSSNPSVAQVDADGVVTGLVVGSTSIHAVIDSKVGTLPVSVINATPSTIAVLPATASVALGKTAQLTVEVRDQAGNLQSSPSVTWSSANSAVASVSSSGLVTATGAGKRESVRELRAAESSAAASDPDRAVACGDWMNLRANAAVPTAAISATRRRNRRFRFMAG